MKKNKKLNILVTGGSGFLGSHLMETLVDSGFNVSNYDLKESKYNIDGVNHINGDLQDLDSLTNALKDINYIYHCFFW